MPDGSRKEKIEKNITTIIFAVPQKDGVKDLSHPADSELQVLLTHVPLKIHSARIHSFLRLRHCLCDDSSSANCVFLSGNSSTNQEYISVVLMCRHAFGTNAVKCSRSQFFHITLVFKINTCQALKATTATNRWHELKKTLPDTWTVNKTRVFAGCCCARMYQP